MGKSDEQGLVFENVASTRCPNCNYRTKVSTPTLPARMIRTNTGREVDAEWEGFVRGWNKCIDQMEYNLRVKP